MKGEIDRDCYCTASATVYYNGNCEYSHKPCDKKYCRQCCHKYPTPEQYKAKYDEEYPEDGAVYWWVVFGEGDFREPEPFDVISYKDAKHEVHDKRMNKGNE